MKLYLNFWQVTVPIIAWIIHKQGFSLLKIAAKIGVSKGVFSRTTERLLIKTNLYPKQQDSADQNGMEFSLAINYLPFFLAVVACENVTCQRNSTCFPGKDVMNGNYICECDKGFVKYSNQCIGM